MPVVYIIPVCNVLISAEDQRIASLTFNFSSSLIPIIFLNSCSTFTGCSSSILACLWFLAVSYASLSLFPSVSLDVCDVVLQMRLSPFQSLQFCIQPVVLLVVVWFLPDLFLLHVLFEFL